MNNEKTLPDDQGSTLCRQVMVTSPNGLHARPAGRLAQAAQGFQASITLAAEGQEVDAKSILDILTLAATHGSSLEIKASGQDAEQALDRLEALFANQFREE